MIIYSNENFIHYIWKMKKKKSMKKNTSREQQDHKEEIIRQFFHYDIKINEYCFKLNLNKIISFEHSQFFAPSA